MGYNSVVTHGWLSTLELSELEAQMTAFPTTITVTFAEKVGVGIGVSSDQVYQVVTAVVVAAIAQRIATTCRMADE